MKRVVVVDDSRTTRVVLRRILEEDARMRVVGEASTPNEASAVVAATQPDLVTMDVRLGDELDGVDLTRTILGSVRTRVVIVSATTKQDSTLSFRALGAGALDVLAKPSGADSVDGRRERDRFVRAILALSDVPIVGSRATPAPASTYRADPVAAAGSEARRIERVLVGASTGGPPLLASIFSRMPAPLPVPVVVVQHISAGFGASFCRWLSVATNHATQYCDRPTRLVSGTIHVAGDSAHLRFTAPASVAFVPSETPRLSTPAVDELFESSAAHDPTGTLALLLTGMGDDGASGMVALRGKGAITVAQRPETCVVGSMPRSAIDRSGADLVLDPDAIVELLRRLPARPIVRR